MKKRVLFSPVGGTDPISNCRDGAMLHICRIYKPDIVWLYLSKEMVEAEDTDHRYSYCLEKLMALIDHSFEIKYIRKEHLENVHVFDDFMEEYQGYLNSIRNTYPDAEILVNVSSGTPAMKNALHFLAAISDFPIQAIQVSTPVKKLNPHEENHQDYDPEFYWEFNDDNGPGFMDRSTESKSQNLVDQIKKKTLQRFIESYDYVAALQIAENLVNPLPGDAISLIRAAGCRMKLDIHGIQNELGSRKNEILPIRDERYRNIFEHLLNLDIKIRKEEYVDFLRGITPVIIDLFELILKKHCGIRLDDYRMQAPKEARWDESKVKANPVVDEILQKSFYYSFNYGLIYSAHLRAIIKELAADEEVVRMTNSLRDIEEDVRNIAAHEIASVTEQWVISHTRENLSPAQINQLLKEYAMKTDIGIKREYWNSYDDMNQVILRAMNIE